MSTRLGPKTIRKWFEVVRLEMICLTTGKRIQAIKNREEIPGFFIGVKFTIRPLDL